MPTSETRPGHGDHWRAVLGEDEGRLAHVIEFPSDAPDSVKLYRRTLTPAVDLVQVTARRRLITAYPEPRATALVTLKPRELLLWDTRVEAWLVAEHSGAGTLTLFLTDLVENARRYEKARGAVTLEVGGLAYTIGHAPAVTGPSRLRPAREADARFFPDDYSLDADVRGMRTAGLGEVIDLEFQGGLVAPISTALPSRLGVGDRAQGYAWLTARWPVGPEEQGS